MLWVFPSLLALTAGRNTEWVAILFSKVSFWPRDWMPVSYIRGRFFTIWGKPTRRLNVQIDTPLKIITHSQEPLHSPTMKLNCAIAYHWGGKKDTSSSLASFSHDLFLHLLFGVYVKVFLNFFFLPALCIYLLVLCSESFCSHFNWYF